jgi:osmoprotectant transport system permease protein
MRLLSVAAARRSRRLAWLAAGAFAVLFACAGTYSAGRLLPSGSGEELIVGAKTFTEQYILAEALARHVERAAGVNAEVRSSLGSSVVFDALRSGSVDLYVDYSGTLWATVMKRPDEPPERTAMLAEIGRVLEREHGVVLVCALGFENAYALAMRRAHAEEIGARSIGDLVTQAGKLTIGGDYEFFGRPEWKAIQERYGLRFKDQRAMDSSLMYEAAATGGVDVISAFSTDGRILAFDLAVLEDDRRAMPPYDAVVLASRSLAARRPDVIRALRGLAGSVDAERMRRMNLAVDRDKRSPQAVAQELAAAWAAGAAAPSGPGSAEP